MPLLEKVVVSALAQVRVAESGISEDHSDKGDEKCYSEEYKESNSGFPNNIQILEFCEEESSYTDSGDHSSQMSPELNQIATSPCSHKSCQEDRSEVDQIEPF